MRQAMLGFCIFAAACSSQPFSPTAPSGLAGVAGTQAQATGARPPIFAVHGKQGFMLPLKEFFDGLHPGQKFNMFELPGLRTKAARLRRIEDIAQAYGITVELLRATCPVELTIRASQLRMGVVDAVYEQAMKGHVTAAQRFLAGVAENGGPPHVAGVGVKAKRNADALTAADGSEWDSLTSRMN